MNADEIKRHEREAYDAVAEVFNQSMAQYSARFSRDLIDLMFPQNGEAALDIAGGTGAAGLKLAERVGKDGNVTIADISPGMLEQAQKNAVALGLSHVRTRIMDAEQLDFPEGTFDLVTCSFGVMFFPDVTRAIGEAYRVLKPGGRVGYVVWSVPERFPFFSCPMTAVLKRMAPAPIRLLLRMPGVGPALLRRLLVSKLQTGFSPARFSGRGSLERHLVSAGFGLVRRELRAYPIEFRNCEEYWNTMTRGTPARAMAARLPPKVFAEVREEVCAQMTNPTSGDIYFHNEAALVFGTKPA
jgi:ubiquinone/menaquinone biosynthesis C-methylase UbiE